jgi:hypothetical protein
MMKKKIRNSIVVAMNKRHKGNTKFKNKKDKKKNKKDFEEE